jgi:hypothetical protein
LESALGHEKSLLLIRSMALKQTMSINDAGWTGKPGKERASSFPADLHLTGVENPVSAGELVRLRIWTTSKTALARLNAEDSQIARDANTPDCFGE